MNKVYRDGVDVEVAFASSAKRMMQKKTLQTGDIGLPPAAENAIIPEQSGLVKTLLRPVIRFVYRIFKPAMRPVAFRLRRYLTEDLRQEVQNSPVLSVQEIRRLSSDLLQEMQATRDLLRQDMLNAHALTPQEIQRLFAEEMNTARESLRQDLLNEHALSMQELQRLSAEEMKTAREFLQELQRVSVNVLQEMQTHASNLFPRLDRIEQYLGTVARRVAINCGQGEILIRTEVGYVLCTESDHALVAYLIENGELEKGTRLLIQRLLSPGDVFVDVGANIGLHTLAAARAIQGRGKIIAFEPFEPTKRLLEKSVWMNGFSEITEIHQAAVSNKTGHQQLFLGDTSGHHSLFPLDTHSGLSLNPVEVPLVRLDVIIQADQKVNLIKIDVEGAELEVLESAASMIRRNPDIALIVEFGPVHLKRTGHSIQQWLSAFTDLGLIYRAINADTGTLEDWSLDQLENTDSINLFFARTGSQSWMKAGKSA